MLLGKFRVTGTGSNLFHVHHAEPVQRHLAVVAVVAVEIFDFFLNLGTGPGNEEFCEQ